MNLSSSPSRRYVALCHRPNLNGFFFRSFTLPESAPNTSEDAATHFMRFMNFDCRVERCISLEDYTDLAEETALEAEEALSSAA